MRTHTCMWWDICFKNAEDYYHAYYNGRVVHCRSMKDDMRGVRVIVVTPKSGSYALMEMRWTVAIATFVLGITATVTTRVTLRDPVDDC